MTVPSAGYRGYSMLSRHFVFAARAALVAALVVLTLAGCASDPRYSQGIDWVSGQEAERKRLEAAGFPQYSGAP
jgi:hypothetical protein